MLLALKREGASDNSPQLALKIAEDLGSFWGQNHPRVGGSQHGPSVQGPARDAVSR